MLTHYLLLALLRELRLDFTPQEFGESFLDFLQVTLHRKKVQPVDSPEINFSADFQPGIVFFALRHDQPAARRPDQRERKGRKKTVRCHMNDRKRLNYALVR